MAKYEVLIARNETTIYTVHVIAKNETEAQTKAWKKYAVNDCVDESVVYGEEEIHEINQFEKEMV